MADELKNVCDVCHERPATHHTICGDTGEWRNLCATCFNQSASPVEIVSYRQFEQVVRSGKCDYCGAPAAAASICNEILGVMEEETHFWCAQCHKDLIEFNKRPENAIPEDFGKDDAKWEQQSQQDAERQRRQDEFMRQRAKERGHNAEG